VNEDKSARYHRLKRRGAVLALGAAAGVPAVFLLSGAAAATRDLVLSVSGGSAVLTVALFVLAYGALHELVGLPLAFHHSFILERRYGLSSEPPGAWLRDHLKAAALGGLMAVAAAEAVYFMLRQWPEWWWAMAAVLFTAALAILAKAAPVVLLPLFYTFTPLDRESLRLRLEALSKAAGVPVLGVYEWGLGEKTRRANAALVGTGRTRRILVSDTLLAEYTDDEIEVILAHELAHHVHHDVLKGLAVEFVLLFGALAAAAAALEWLWRGLGLHSPADVAGLPLLLLAGGGVMIAATPLVNALSRFNERRADGYALRLTRQSAAFISAMRRLAAQNLAEERPSRLVLWLFHSHPPFEERIDAARRLLNP
jgi:STE24 endopeptidase